MIIFYHQNILRNLNLCMHAFPFRTPVSVLFYFIRQCRVEVRRCTPPPSTDFWPNQSKTTASRAIPSERMRVPKRKGNMEHEIYLFFPLSCCCWHCSIQYNERETKTRMYCECEQREMNKYTFIQIVFFCSSLLSFAIASPLLLRHFCAQKELEN